MAAKDSAAREIALAFGVPPLVLGLPGDNTFSNYQEAHRAFWRQAVIPLINRIQQGSLVAEIPLLTGGRKCVYQFDFGSIVVDGPTNLGCRRKFRLHLSGMVIY